MPAITDFINRVVPQDSSSDQAMLSLGLPLETESKTIYPVFQQTGARAHRRLQQVGYLEISENRSDYISLEPRRSAPVAILGFFAILMAAVIWLFRRTRA